jgi:energy-coupling factor transporter ATP-binding protein EcfA2
MSIRFESLSFRYSVGESAALKDVTVEIEPRAVTLVTGRLGAGSSTLLLVAAGLAPRITGGNRQGTVTTLGYDPDSKDGHSALTGRLGLLLSTPWTQLSGMSFTVREEVAFGPANLGWRRDRIADAVDKAMVLMQVEGLALRDPRTLSGGELQRVMLAGVAAMDPEVLLLDEPTIELDPAGARLVYDLLPELARDRTVVVASTDVDRAVEVADRVLLLDRGRLVAEGDAGAVLGSESAASMGCGTTVGGIMRAAGVEPAYPITVDAAMRCLGR